MYFTIFETKLQFCFKTAYHLTLKKGYSLKEIQQKMADFCVYQDRCHQDVEKKLRNFDLIPEAKDAILLFLIEHNFLNEERFSLHFAQGKFNQKKWGKNRIRRELQIRNIHNRLIQKSLNQINSDDYQKTIQQLYLKKKREIKEKNPYKKKQKIYRYLVYKGFESEFILNLLNTD